MKESFIKYLAGLLDADGCLSLNFKKSSSGKYFLHLRLSLTASSAVDRDFKILKTVHKETGIGRISKSTRLTDINGDVSWKWEVGKRGEIETILPRIIKHSVIKGKHFQRLLDMYRKLKGRPLTLKQVDALKKWSKRSRLKSGPVKPKKHPTWAWAAGYIDGDGCLTYKYYPDKHWYKMDIHVITQETDSCGIELLQKAFKGEIYNKKEHLKVWKRNLGYADFSFVKRFLPKLIQYSLIKRYHMEQILAIHNKRRKQRLTERGSTEQEKVQ